jgi:RHS repeat-associated protein
VHVDHLGSTDALTGEKGTIDERRSYDVFGQRRNPIWGQPPPASFSAKTTRGYTGHEADHELGLVNMKGRIFDPRLGRFLTTDPIVSNQHSGQAFNRYAYVLNNPLSLVDPSGFEPDDLPPSPASQVVDANQPITVWVIGEPRRPREPKEEGTNPNAEIGASAPPIDVGVTGDSSSDAARAPPGISLDDVRRNPYTQLEGGFIGGLLLGLVPFGGTGYQALDAARVLPSSTVNAQIGFSLGLFVGGIITLLEGVGGDIVGGAATATVVGAPVGVPAIVVSTGVAVGGLANIGAGITGLLNALSQGSGSSGPPTGSGNGGSSPGATGAAGGERAGLPFTRKDKSAVKTDNAAAHGGQTTCMNCGQPTVPAQQSRTGVTPPQNETQIDHVISKAKNGNGSPDNAQLLCRGCNLKKGDK